MIRLQIPGRDERGLSQLELISADSEDLAKWVNINLMAPGRCDRSEICF